VKTLDLSQASKPLSEYARDVQDEPIVVTEDDEPVAFLVSIKGVDTESLALGTSAEFLRIIQAAREEVERGEVLSLEEMRREVL
jgi:antitoxin (DNA-binding transcriptional repressor) of toxin-antitoxin stability system